jgi:serine/threonine protein kinase
LVPEFKYQRKEVAQIRTMLYQILLALDHVHTHNPQIIYRDRKPPNILSQGDDFFLTDFGIAKVVDTSRLLSERSLTRHLSFWLNGYQTPKVDIYALGAPLVECLEEFPPEAEWLNGRSGSCGTSTSKHFANQHGIAPMLANVDDQRMTARELLQSPEVLFPLTPHTNSTD